MFTLGPPGKPFQIDFKCFHCNTIQYNMPRNYNSVKLFLHLKVDKGTRTRFHEKYETVKLKSISLWVLVYYIMSPFGFNIPPLELDCSICYASGVLVLIIPRLTLLEAALIDMSRVKFAL